MTAATTTRWEWTAARPTQRWALIVGAGALALCAVGALFDRQQFFRSYLLAFITWLSFPLGSLALLMLHHLTGGYWGLVIRRILEAAGRTLPLLLIMFLPILLGLADIFSWAGHETPHEPIPNAGYLNVPFFLVRAGIYFAAWIALAFVLDRWSAAHDRTGDAALLVRAQHLSGPGLVIYGMTVTFAAIDWIMSLDPHWSSSIFGPLVAMGQMLPALALAIAVASCLADQPPLDRFATPTVWNDLGNLLLAFVMLWTYMAFAQFLLIWSGNLPEEITWYLNREAGGWLWVAVALAVFYFALPFVLLLMRDLKRRPEWLRWIAGAVVAMNLVNQFWMIVPTFSPQQLWLHWMDVTAVVGVGGLWLAYFLWQIQARPLLPVHDPLVAEALGHA
jgi:hypothetical protein